MKKLIPLLLVLAIPAHAANWLLAADSGQNLANNGAKATISDADLPNNTLRVTVENAADHTLVLGRHTTNYGNDNTTARADRNGVYSGPVDLAKPIYAAGDDVPWTITSVANMAFYNNKDLLTAPDGILDLSTVTNIGIGAFGNVTAMPGFRLSHDLQRVGASAFMSDFGTTSFDSQLPASLKRPPSATTTNTTRTCTWICRAKSSFAASKSSRAARSTVASTSRPSPSGRCFGTSARKAWWFARKPRPRAFSNGATPFIPSRGSAQRRPPSNPTPSGPTMSVRA